MFAQKMSAKGGGSAEEDAGREEFVGYTGKFYDPKGTNFLARAGSTDQHPGGLGTTVQNIPNKLGEAGRPVVELAAANCVLDVDDLPSVLPQGLAQASHSHARCAELADAIPDGIMVFLGIGPGELYTWRAYPTGCNTEEAKAASTRKVRDDILAGIKGPPALPHALPDVLYTSAVPLSACALVDALKSAGITYVLYHRERIHGTLRSFRDLDMYSQRGHDLVCDLARSSPELGWLKRWNAYQIDGTFVTDRVWVVGVYAGEDSLSNATVTPLYPGLLKASYGMIEATNLELGHHSNIVAVKISPRHEGQQRWFGASFEKPNAEYYGGAVKLLEYCKSSLLEVDNAAKGIGGLTMRLTVKATRPIEAWRECEHSGIFSPLQMLQALGECKDYENQTWYPVHGITTQVIKAHGQRLIEAGLNLMSRFAGNGLTSSTNRNNLRDCMAAVGQTSDGKGANTSFVEGQEVWWVYQESKATTTASKRKGPARNKGSLMPPDTKHATGEPWRLFCCFWCSGRET